MPRLLAPVLVSIDVICIQCQKFISVLTYIATLAEMFKKLLDFGMAGDNIGALLRGLKREDVERGQVLCKPGSVSTAKKFEAEIYCLSQDEGGRRTPFFSNYRPQFFFRECFKLY